MNDFIPLGVSFATPHDLGSARAYTAFCRAAAVTPRPAGYGLVLGQDLSGRRYTYLVDDLAYVRSLEETGPENLTEAALHDMRDLRRDGWPDEWELPAGSSPSPDEGAVPDGVGATTYPPGCVRARGQGPHPVGAAYDGRCDGCDAEFTTAPGAVCTAMAAGRPS
ncbi:MULTISPECIES: hypothetical protein [unclassified Streptomyces]|uniref:hypothetical protein n=1 Tax=unclassified Streptomyces TaxID=2593676 RepID=UPI002E2AE017|nr:hypothetical protein [Streptomyces sp. NBC_01429]